MKNFKCIISLCLLLVCVFSMMTIAVPTQADAATTGNSIKTYKVDTSGWYMAKKDLKLRTGTGKWAGTFATIKSGTVFPISGSTKTHYIVTWDGVKYYIARDSSKVTKAGSSRYASLYYVDSSSAPLRKSPHDSSGKSTVYKGKVLPVLGTVIHKNNEWLVVAHQGGVRFIYKPHCSYAKKITLKVTGSSSTVGVDETLKLSYSVSPSEVTVQWSSDDTSIAKVAINGRVTGVSVGQTKIRATIPGINFSVSYTVNVDLELNVKAVRQTTGYTCSAASALTVLRYKGKAKNVSDATLYKKTRGVTGNITDVLNSYLGKNTYTYSKFTSYSEFEKAVVASLEQDCPAIVRIQFKKKYFSFNSDGHFSTIIALYEKEGQLWAKLADSYAHNYKSNSYTNRDTGIVNVPLKTLYGYMNYGPGRYMIYNN